MAKRLLVLPEYPTVAEAGYPSYNFEWWFGVSAPAKTPQQIIATIHSAVVSALDNPSIRKRLSDFGFITTTRKPDEFAAYIKAEVERFSKIMRESGVTAE